MGERRAIGGYHPQYRVAAGLIVRALRNGALDWIRVADPDAGRVDDPQIVPETFWTPTRSSGAAFLRPSLSMISFGRREIGRV